MGKATNRAAAGREITPEGRENMRAAGRATVGVMLEARRTAPNVKEISKRYEESLDALFGGAPTPAQKALTLSATASYTGTFIVLQRLRSAHRYKVIEGLLSQLTPLQGALARALRDLGLTPKDAGDTGDDESLEAIKAEYDRKGTS